MPKKKEKRQNKKLIYVRTDLLDTWDSLDNKSGFVQMHLEILKESQECPK